MSERIPEVVCERININESEVLVFSVKNGLSKIGICRINSEYDKYCLYSHDEPVMVISGGMNDDDADKVISEYGSASGGSIIADSIDGAYEKLAAGGSPEYALEPLMRLLSDGLYAVSYVETYPTAGENMFFWSGYGVSKQLRNSSKKFFNKDYNPEVDRKVSRQLIALYARLVPAEQRISIFQLIDKKFQGNTDAFVDACFSQSVFSSPEALERFLKKPDAETLANDLMVQYASSVKKGYQATSDAMKAETNAYNRAHKTCVAGMLELKHKEKTPVYPDANSTLRLTYGKIGSYEPADGKEYLYYTTLKGVMEKEDPNNPEFVVPARLKELYEKKDFGPYAMPDGRMPICFATATDNTGGNSGSPVFNAKGELIGTGFDRNYEGLTGDIAYNPQLQRAAVVDIRYTLFIIDKYAGAGHLIKEMTIIR